jgi:hypothetical protein
MGTTAGAFVASLSATACNCNAGGQEEERTINTSLPPARRGSSQVSNMTGLRHGLRLPRSMQMLHV